MTVLWHNPRCSKSRATLALLQERGLAPRLRHYLDEPPSVAELRMVQQILGLPVTGMLRRCEPAFRDLGLSETDPEEALLAAMASHPILIERPIVLHLGRAAIGRPPEAVLALL